MVSFEIPRICRPAKKLEIQVWHENASAGGNGALFVNTPEEQGTQLV